MKNIGLTIIHVLTALLAILDGVLAESANIQQFSAIDPKLAQYWPQILVGIIALDRIAKIILLQLQPPKP